MSTPRERHDFPFFFHTFKEVLKLCRMSKAKGLRLIRQKKIKITRIGRRIFVRSDHLQEFLASCEQ
jgi:hypothetical protein